MGRNSGKLELGFSDADGKKTRLIIVGIVVVILAAVGGTVYSLIGNGDEDSERAKGIETRWYVCRNSECGGEAEGEGEGKMPPWRWSIKVPKSTPLGQDADGKPLVCPQCGTDKPMTLRKCPSCLELYGEYPDKPKTHCPHCRIDLAKWRKEHADDQ